MNETAFPVPSVLNSNGDPIVGTRGMSLRDYFAAKAMLGLIHHFDFVPFSNDPMRLAGWAYDAADAMLKEREK